MRFGRWNIIYCCSSVARLCLTLCDPMDRSMLGFPVLHHLPGFAQTHVHWADDAIQPSHPLSPSFPPAFSLSLLPSVFPSIRVLFSELALRIRWPKISLPRGLIKGGLGDGKTELLSHSNFFQFSADFLTPCTSVHMSLLLVASRDLLDPFLPSASVSSVQNLLSSLILLPDD